MEMLPSWPDGVAVKSVPLIGSPILFGDGEVSWKLGGLDSMPTLRAGLDIVSGEGPLFAGVENVDSGDLTPMSAPIRFRFAGGVRL